MRNLQEVDYWHNEGRAEGLAEGRTEGQLQARRQWLLALLENRFGSLPEELIRRIQSLEDVQRLDHAFQQAMKVELLAELEL
jgi:flagellar biosynthesis/type III secretory pathway protein FliH